MKKKINPNPQGELIKRFTKEQREFCNYVLNNIAEDMEVKATKEELLVVIAYLGDLHAVTSRECAELLTKLEIAKCGGGFLNIAVKYFEETKQRIQDINRP